MDPYDLGIRSKVNTKSGSFYYSDKTKSSIIDLIKSKVKFIDVREYHFKTRSLDIKILDKTDCISVEEYFGGDELL